MTRNRVFISYSHCDEAFLKQFRVHLTFWEEQGLLELWSDQEITPSEDWHQTIQEALAETAVAVLLVSPDFLASKYICQQELPVLLRAREEGHIELACLYLRKSIVNDDETTFEVTLSTGDTLTIKLTKYQGFNSPDAVLAAMDEPGRDVRYANAASELKKLVQRKTRRAVRSSADKRFDLTVRFKRNGNDLTRTYLHPYGAITEHRSAWKLPSYPAAGSALFDTLFGSQETCDKVLQFLFQTELARPIRYPVRVRLQSDEPILADLSWPDVEWETNNLCDHGWTFEQIGGYDLSTSPDFPDVTLKTPCPVVMIAPRQAPGAEQHHRALEERLKHAWPFYHETPAWVSTWPEWEHAWTQRQPRIMYYYGPAERDGQTLTLLLDDDQGNIDRRSLSELAQLWQTHPPDVLFCNIVAETPMTMGTTASNLNVPLVITQSSTEPVEARRAALTWFHDILEGSENTDPVWALHQHGLPTAVAWSAYAKWTTRTVNQPARDTLARLLLDRKAQRGLGHDTVSELVRDGQRRLCSVLAYGAEGNLVELFPEQLYEHLRRNAKEVAQVLRIPLRLPATPSFDIRRLELEVQKQLGLGHRDSFGEALAQRQPRGPGRARPVLLLDWGVRGTTEANRLSIEGLEAWLDFCRHPLSTQCPKTLRLVSCLALEIAPERHATLEHAVDALRAAARFRDRALRIELLPPLDQIGANDLADFLNGADNSSCPDDLIAVMPELIVTKTRGQFQQTVDLLEQAERSGWYNLYDDLVTELGLPESGQPPKDTLF